MYCSNCFSTIEEGAVVCPRCNQSGTAKTPLPSSRSKPDRSSASRSMLIWGLVLLGGIGATLATYTAAQPGSRFVVFWGAIAVGAIQFVRAVIRWSDGE